MVVFFSTFRPHLNSACATFQVKRVNLHLRNDVRQIYIYINMKIPPLYSLVWGSLRLAPISFCCSAPKDLLKLTNAIFYFHFFITLYVHELAYTKDT